VLPGYHQGRVRPFYLPVLPLYGFTKLYTNPFLLIYYLPSFKLPVLVLVWGIERKKLNSGSHTTPPMACTDCSTCPPFFRPCPDVATVAASNIQTPLSKVHSVASPNLVHML
jgi:hypothetical protein